MSMIYEAITFATKMHEGQYRKKTDIPYIVHPFSAMYSLKDCGIEDEEVLIATLLHDVIEDSGVTYDDINAKFEKQVANLVSSVSENKALSWDERKLHTVEDLKSSSYETKLIILADKSNNLSTIVKDYNEIGDQLWNRFNRGYLYQRWYYTRLYFLLKSDIQINSLSLFEKYEKLIIELFKDLYPTPVLSLPNENPGEKTICYGEGILSNGILYLSEYWFVDGISNYTYYFGDVFNENVSDESVMNLLIKDGLVEFYTEKQFYSLRMIKDINGNDAYTMNIVIGDDENTFANANSLVKRSI